MVGPALAEAIGSLHPHMAEVSRYHLGFTDELGRPVQNPGGKYLRPALALLSAEAVGAPASAGLPGAVAVELVHDFSLLHDDVMDGDEQRRHRPTAWTVFGEAKAILGGDALLSLAFTVLLEGAGEHGMRAARRLNRAVGALVSGQADDLGFETRPVVDPEECVAMSACKTGALLSCSAAIGAELAGAPPEPVDALADFGLHLGLAFQAVDDLLGIWGSPEVTGKPHGDLWRNKKSLPVCAALAADPGGPLAGMLRGELGDDGAAAAARLVEEAGGRDFARDRAAGEIGLAMTALDRADPPAETRAQLEELASFITGRDF
jgi:geranylgeranyl diphosphate synthase type I